MAITGSLSLNNVTKVATTPYAQFWVYVNISSTSDTNFVEQNINLDSVLVRGPDDISSHGLVYGTVGTPIGINVAVSYTGPHLIEIELKIIIIEFYHHFFTIHHHVLIKRHVRTILGNKIREEE